MRLDEKLTQYEQELLKMANYVRNAMSRAIDALAQDDKTLALDIVERDDIINGMDQSINEAAVEMLSLLQPVAKDLRMIVGGIKISSDLERIGDYAKNIARYVIKRKEAPESDISFTKEFGAQFLYNFDEVISAMKHQDVKAAYLAVELDEKLDSMFKSMILELAEVESKDSLQPLEFTGLLRNIERAGDHSKNICEHIIYVVKGRYIDFG